MHTETFNTTTRHEKALSWNYRVYILKNIAHSQYFILIYKNVRQKILRLVTNIVRLVTIYTKKITSENNLK